MRYFNTHGPVEIEQHIGIQNIARLNFGRSSSFNIAYQQRLNGFSLDELINMIAEYTTESGQHFESDALTMLHKQTAGHPLPRS